MSLDLPMELSAGLLLCADADHERMASNSSASDANIKGARQVGLT